MKHLENDFANIRINKELWFEMPQTFFILNGIYVNKNTIALNHRTCLRSDLTVHMLCVLLFQAKDTNITLNIIILYLQKRKYIKGL